MSYTVYDFAKSLDHLLDMEPLCFTREDVAECLAAWEDSDHNEWTARFLLKLKDGRVALLSGWRDTAGWGCRDGIEVRFVKDGNPLYLDPEFDYAPPDLNRYLRGEIDRSWEPER